MVPKGLQTPPGTVGSRGLGSGADPDSGKLLASLSANLCFQGVPAAPDSVYKA